MIPVPPRTNLDKLLEKVRVNHVIKLPKAVGGYIDYNYSDYGYSDYGY